MDAVEEVKSRLSIEDIVGEYVELKRSGRNYKGLSPFGNERTPSFMVSPEKQIWHDFSSGKGGDMFTFVMELEGLDFKAALELLARKAGVDLEQFRSSGSGERGKQKERLYEALELATKFYQAHFKQNKTALEYIFKKRQFTKETVLAFRLGYSPESGTVLMDFMKSKGFTEAELKAAGLATQRYRGWGDMFRGRIMVPLQDPQGRVIGFTARLLADNPDAPKYINTPQTNLYDKGRHVYGLHMAKEAIRKIKYAVAVEGNLDVIASHQAGIKQVVATAGTAMTDMHLKALGRFTHDVRLAFDQDNAGLNAAERVIPMAGKAGVTLSIITIPEGKDPDELVKKDPRLWQAVVDQPQYALDWLIDRYSSQLDLSGATGKRQFTDIVLRVVRRLEDSVEQDHYVHRIAAMTGITPEAVRQKTMKQANEAKPRLRQTPAPAKVDKAGAELVRTQHQLLSLGFMVPNMREFLNPVTPDMLTEEDARKLLEFIRSNPEFGLTGKGPLPAALRKLENFVKILQLLFEELYQGLEFSELQYEATRLQVRLIEQYVKTKKSALSEAMRSSNEAQTTELLMQARELDELLNKFKAKS